MGLNGVSLSSLVMAKRIMVYTDKTTQKVEKADHQQPSAHQSPKQDQAIIQGKEDSLNQMVQTSTNMETSVDPILFEPNTYTLKNDSAGVEQVIPTGKTIKKEA